MKSTADPRSIQAELRRRALLEYNGRLLEADLDAQARGVPTWSDRWWGILHRLNEVRTSRIQAMETPIFEKE